MPRAPSIRLLKDKMYQRLKRRRANELEVYGESDINPSQAGLNTVEEIYRNYEQEESKYDYPTLEMRKAVRVAKTKNVQLREERELIAKTLPESERERYLRKTPRFSERLPRKTHHKKDYAGRIATIERVASAVKGEQLRRGFKTYFNKYSNRFVRKMYEDSGMYDFIMNHATDLELELLGYEQFHMGFVYQESDVKIQMAIQRRAITTLGGDVEERFQSLFGQQFDDYMSDNDTGIDFHKPLKDWQRRP